MDVLVIACPLAAPFAPESEATLPVTGLPARSGAAQPLQLPSAHPTVAYCTDSRVYESFTNCTAILMSVPEEFVRHLVGKHGKESFFAVWDDR